MKISRVVPRGQTDGQT